MRLTTQQHYYQLLTIFWILHRPLKQPKLQSPVFEGEISRQ